MRNVNQDYKHYGTDFVLMDSNALILVSLNINHNISFVENKNVHLGQIKEPEFGRPIQELSRCTNEDVIGQLGATRNYSYINLNVTFCINLAS